MKDFKNEKIDQRYNSRVKMVDRTKSQWSNYLQECFQDKAILEQAVFIAENIILVQFSLGMQYYGVSDVMRYESTHTPHVFYFSY